MKNLKSPLVFTLVVVALSFLVSCDNDKEELNSNEINQIVSLADKEALLFMLEEEKLARDTYTYLNSIWSINQFANIKNSEQTHMNAVENLLIEYDIDYTILPNGKFEDQSLQNLYNKFEIDGAISQANALQIGATIEDLDIVDLQEYLDVTSNVALISVFESLQCGSRNHLRSFVATIENSDNTYTPQFLTIESYNSILSDSREQCN